MGRLIDDHPELITEWDYEKNRDLSPEDFTSGNHKSVWWQCDKGHEWEATIANRCKGTGCPYCSGKRAITGVNDLATVNPELAAEWHPTRNGTLTPKDIKPGSEKKAWWFGKCGHEWEAKIIDRSNGSGCPICSGRQVLPGYNDLATTNPSLAAEWNQIRNENLSPQNVTSNSYKKVWWKCEQGHEWEATVYDRSNGNGCPYCSGRRAISGENDLATVNPELAAEWHPTKNGNLKPQDILPMSNKKVWWQCTNSHEWEATVADRSNGNDCPICSGHQVLPGFNDLATVNPTLAAQWHPTKNGELSPEHVTAGSGKKVWWQCELGHEWQASINSRSKGSGCPYCAKELSTSFPEQAILYYLGKVAQAQNRIKIHDKFEVDIFLPDLNSAIEYDGWHWHEGIASSQKEYQKNEYLTQVGIRLIRVKEIKGKQPIPLDTKDIIYCLYTLDYSYLTDVVNRLTQRLSLPDIDVDIERDKAIIWDQYIDSVKNNSLSNTLPDVAAQWHPTKNGNLTPDKVTCASNKKVWWCCDKGHEWEAIISARSKGVGCPICSGNQVLAGFNDLATTNPSLAKEWHSTKNGDLTPQDITQMSNKKVWWQCEKGHEWEAIVASRSKGNGCPICAGKQALIGYNDLATINPKLADEWHPTKNGNLMPQDVLLLSNKRVWWLGPCGHEWEAIIANRTKGSGCPICAGQQVLPGFNDLESINPNLALEWHPTKNGNLKPSDVLPMSHKKVWWICNKGHEWQAAISHRSNGRGCPICSGKQVLIGFNDLATINPKLASQWHPTKNGSLTPEQVTAGSGKRVWWQCELGHEWQATIYDRNNGHSCPICQKNRTTK